MSILGDTRLRPCGGGGGQARQYRQKLWRGGRCSARHIADLGGRRFLLCDRRERRRVAIARAIVSRPDLLIADEPTAGRDDETALSLLRAFERLHSLGTAVLIATDNIALARRLGCRHLHLEEGWLTSLDTAAIQ